tara:strand:- start:553 stop:807 length:255 start_codon:yes stop_codon:yes gene_type:complete
MPKKEKYPEKCPWDSGPLIESSSKNSWILKRGADVVIFSKSEKNEHFFILQENDQEQHSVLAFQARLTYQKLLDKGYRLDMSAN